MSLDRLGNTVRTTERRQKMTKILAAAAAVGAFALLSSPAANAITNAENDYLNDLHAAGITGADQTLIADGHTMCSAIAAGTHPNDLSATYYSNATGLSHAQADAAVNLAIKDLCPTG
jgi:hypothetical protein